MNKLPIEVFLNKDVYNVKAFNRTKVAHANKDLITDNVAYNEVDSVVYIKNKRNIDDHFLAGRKYSYGIECLSGTIELEYNLESELQLLNAYDDLSDRAEYIGVGHSLELKAGEIAIFELNEAIKYKKTLGQFIEYKIAKDGGIK